MPRTAPSERRKRIGLLAGAFAALAAGPLGASGPDGEAPLQLRTLELGADSAARLATLNDGTAGQKNGPQTQTGNKPETPLESLRFDPDSAAELAVRQGPAVIAAAIDIQAKAADLEAARLVWRPTVSIQSALNRGRGESTGFQAVQNVPDPGTPSGFAEGNFMSNTISLTMPIYLSGTLFSRETPLAVQSEGNRAVAEETLKLQAAGAANLAVKAYFNAALALEQRRLYEAQYALNLKSLEIVRQRVEARQSRLEDQLLIETAAAASLAGLNTARSLNTTKLVEFRAVLGLPDAQPLQFAPVTDDVPRLPGLSGLIESLVSEHPKVRTQQAAVQIARGALLQTKGNYAPTLSFVSSYTTSSALTGDSLRPNFSVYGITLSVPIADFGQSDAKIRSKAHSLSESEQQLLAVRSTLVQSLATSYHAATSTVELLPSARTKLEQLKYTEQVTQAKFDLGEVVLDKLISDQSNRLNQEIVLLGSKFAAWGAYADFISVAGKPYSSQALPASR